MRVTNRLVDSILTASESDASIGTQFSKVTGLIDPPTRLLRPWFLCRVAAVNLVRRQRHSRRDPSAVTGPAESAAASPEVLS
jgi:hypothetical protein